MPLSPEDVERQVFKEKIRGYDMEEVDAFLDRVVERMRELTDERDRLARELQSAGSAGGAGASGGEHEDADLLRRTLVTAQRAADQTLAEARTEADRLLAGARDEAVRERERLHGEVEELARALEDLKRFRRDYAERVRGVIEDHLRVLDERALPEVPGEAEEAARRAAGTAAAAGGYIAEGAAEPLGRSALDTAEDYGQGYEDAESHVGDY